MATVASAVETAPGQRSMSALEQLRRHPAGNIIIVSVLVQIGAILAGLLSPTLFGTEFRYLTPENLTILFRSIPQLAIVAVGVGILMVAKEFDLSVGAVFGLTPLVTAATFEAGFPIIPAILVGLAVAALAGFVNGFIVVKTGIPSFIATLGAMLALRGVIRAINDSRPVRFYPGDTVEAVFTGSVGGVQAQFIWFVVIAIAGFLFLQRHRFGNHVYMTGGSEGSARAVGVNTDRVKVIAFMISSTLAGFAGLMGAIRVNSAVVTQGLGLELEAIAACVIGGVALTGGVGVVLGICLGAILINVVENILLLARAPGYYHEMFVGIIIVAAVVLNTYVAKKD